LVTAEITDVCVPKVAKVEQLTAQQLRQDTAVLQQVDSVQQEQTVITVVLFVITGRQGVIH
jgi:hypothetical protein